MNTQIPRCDPDSTAYIHAIRIDILAGIVQYI